jgi:hypothetical protein
MPWTSHYYWSKIEFVCLPFKGITTQNWVILITKHAVGFCVHHKKKNCFFQIAVGLPAEVLLLLLWIITSPISKVEIVYYSFKTEIYEGGECTTLRVASFGHRAHKHGSGQ